MPRPGSRVIPAKWEAHHRPVAESTMTAQCTIRAPGGTQGAFNQATGTYDVVPHASYYTGGCRVQALLQPNEAAAAEQPVTKHDYLVVVPATVTQVQLGHIVTVTGGDATLDQSLVGRQLIVEDVQRGSLIWERDLGCIDQLG